MHRWLSVALVALIACDNNGSGYKKPDHRLSLEELKDPKTCKACHLKHYNEWRRSMHAYASLDPVFRAMNKRGQRETNKDLGKFCVQCHAPMAYRDGLTENGLNLDDLPESAQGVTCYFCHNAVDVGTDHFNNSLTLANDDVMRAELHNAVDPGLHGVAYSPSHDANTQASAILCGSCHDVVNTHGVAIETTFQEYNTSIYSVARAQGVGADSCQGCHMPSTTDVIAEVPGLKLPQRDRHAHDWPGVDVALSDFPDADGRAAQEHATQCAIATTGMRLIEIVNLGEGLIQVQLETEAGHNQPSGTAQDRRLWVEFTAYDDDGTVLLESGKIGDQDLEEYPEDDPQGRFDPNLCLFRNVLLDDAGNRVDMFWEAAKSSDQDRKVPFLIDPNNRHLYPCQYQIPSYQTPARVEVTMHMRPVGMDVLQSLIDSGDLDPAIRDQMKTWTLDGMHAVWTADSNTWSVLPSDLKCD